MKKYVLISFILCALLMLGGCGEKEKTFVAGENELIHLTSTPMGGVETYEIYTTNIMIYVDGTVKIYASDFVKWLGKEEDIPEITLNITPEQIEEIKQLIVENDLYNLRENVGNKDGISGTLKQMTIYAVDGTNTTGGVSVSNRQFTRSYDRIENLVREDLFLYQSEINKIQYQGYIEFINRRVEFMDRGNECLFNHQDINDVYAHTEEISDEEKVYYVIVEFNQHGGELLRELSDSATADNTEILTLYLSGNYETQITITGPLNDYKLHIPQASEEDALALATKIKECMR
ncbi:MAG: hypothetical protein E7257_08370 [Lachnospiraceae bacterium]|nr:hypothetical protein [Lachnospiraceae bacterium]